MPSLSELLRGPKPTAPDPERAIREAYRATFTSMQGRIVLTHMLTELGFFNETAGPEEQALANYARRILWNLGVVNAENLNNLQLINALLSISKIEPGHNMTGGTL